MDHVVVPLDPAHSRVVAELACELSDACGAAAAAIQGEPHVTLVSYTGVSLDAAAGALAPVAAATAPFVVRAHGYGIFAGDDPRELSLHVMVVRTRALDRLHGRVHQALCRAGAEVEGLTEARVWTPHITLLDRHLSPAALGRAVELLAQRPHRSWSIDVQALVIGRRTGGGSPLRLPLGHRADPATA